MTSGGASTKVGPGEVLGLIRRGVAVTRREVQDVTGLSRVTSAHRVDQLLRAGLVRESGGTASTGGRPANRLEFNPLHRVVLAASITTRHARVGVLGLDGTLLAASDRDADPGRGPAQTLELVCDVGEDVLRVAGKTVHDVAGVGVALPCPIDPQTGRPDEPPGMPGWHDADVAALVRERVNTTVIVENNANAMAMGEFVHGQGADRGLVLLDVSTGLGAGIILGGRVVAGGSGGAGDIGHIRVQGEEGRRCRCGALGCLAATASGSAIADDLRRLGRTDVVSATDVARLVAAGDPEAAALVEEAGKQIGEVTAYLVCLVDPHTLVIAGDLASPQLQSAVLSAMIPRTTPRATRNLHVRMASLGQDAGLVGLSRLIVDHVYAPTAVDRRIRA